MIGHDEVVGIDIDVRPHNRKEIEKHPLYHRIRIIEGSSTDPIIVDQVRAIAYGSNKVIVMLDSNHSHDHVLRELNAYADLVNIGSYCVVYDIAVEDMPDNYDWKGRPWEKGNSPKTAVHEFLRQNKKFKIDDSIHNKLLITVAPDGYLKRVK